MFALFAYGVAAGCFVIGYRDATEANVVCAGERGPAARAADGGCTPSLSTTWTCPSGTQVWFDYCRHQLGRLRRRQPRAAVGHPELTRHQRGDACDRVRVRDPDGRRLTPLRLGLRYVVFGALALTYARSAWVALVAALVGILVITRGRAHPPGRGGGPGSGRPGAGRVQRLDRCGAHGPGGHGSARWVATNPPRSVRPHRCELIPGDSRSRLGRGIGTAGEATRLTGRASGIPTTAI